MCMFLLYTVYKIIKFILLLQKLNTGAISNSYHGVGYAVLNFKNKYYKNCFFLFGDFQIIFVWVLVKLNNSQRLR